MWALFLSALAVRIAALSVAAMTGRFPEFWEPEVIARSILAGRGFLYRLMGTDRWAYQEPLYPFLVAAVYAISDFSVVALAVVQVVASALLAVVTYAIALRAGDRSVALTAGGLVAIHPALAGYATTFHPVTFDALAIAVVTLAAVRLIEQPRPGSALFLGLGTGLGTLTRPTILAFAAALGLWMLSVKRHRQTVPHFVLAMVIASVVVAPWVIRNYMRLDAFVLTRSHVGFGLWLGNHRGATGGEGDLADPTAERSLFAGAPPELRDRVLSRTSEVAQDRVFLSEAVRYIVDEPGAFVVRTIAKLGYFWWFPPYLGKRYADAQVFVYRVFYVLILALALIGLAAGWRRRPTARTDQMTVIVLLLAAISMAQSLFYVQGRHRVAVEAVLIVLSACGLVRLARIRATG